MLDCLPTRSDDIPILAVVLRPEDVEEIDAASGLSPEEALRMSYTLSDECITVWDVDEPIAIFGYKVTIPDVCAVVWMLGSPKIFEHRIEFLKRSNFWVDYIHKKVPLLYNMVYHKNTVHIKWLRWLGFVFVQRIENAGVKGQPFIEFARLKNV